jgi:hypothetical protein
MSHFSTDFSALSYIDIDEYLTETNANENFIETVDEQNIENNLVHQQHSSNAVQSIAQSILNPAISSVSESESRHRTTKTLQKRPTSPVKLKFTYWSSFNVDRLIKALEEFPPFMRHYVQQIHKTHMPDITPQAIHRYLVAHPHLRDEAKSKWKAKKQRDITAQLLRQETFKHQIELDFPVLSSFDGDNSQIKSETFTATVDSAPSQPTYQIKDLKAAPKRKQTHYISDDPWDYVFKKPNFLPAKQNLQKPSHEPCLTSNDHLSALHTYVQNIINNYQPPPIFDKPEKKDPFSET